MQQVHLPMLKTVCPPRLVDDETILRLPTFRSSLRFAVNQSGLTQEDIAEVLRIDNASFTRMICDPRHIGARPREFPHEKLSDFCLVTGCLAPVQWHAAKPGMMLIASRESRIQRLERELAAERAQAYQQEVA